MKLRQMNEISQQFSWGSLNEINSKTSHLSFEKAHVKTNKERVDSGAREAQQKQPTEQTAG
jgi:hypothetical protein